MQRVPAGLAKDLDRAATFAESPKMLSAFRAASGDPKLWSVARKRPAAFLESKGVKTPKGLAVKFLNDPMRGMPTPDYEMFTIRVFNCRTFWVRKKTGVGYERIEVCFGFEIVSHPLPGGPIG